MDQHKIWSERYRATGEDFLFGMAPNRFLEHRNNLLGSGHSVLCVADGEGRNSVWLAEQGLDVTAVEITEVAVTKARKLAAGRNVTVNFEIGDILSPDWPPSHQRNTFDWVIGIFIQFVGPADRARQMAALKQLEYKTGGPSAVENLYTPEILRDLFEGWAIEELVEYEDDISEGLGHKGLSALIGMVARKPETAN